MKRTGLSPTILRRTQSMHMRATMPKNTMTRTPSSESSRLVPVVSIRDQIEQRTAMGMKWVRIPVIFMNSS